MTLSIIILGGGGHAGVLLEIASRLKLSVTGFSDITNPSYLPERVAWLGDDEAVFKLDPEGIVLANGLGSVGDTKARRQIHERFKHKGYHFVSLIHPNATLSSQNLQLEEGLQVMAGAVIAPHVQLGENVLINSGAVVEHDCRVGRHSHVASGAVICGGCKIGEGVHIGAGATLIQELKVGDGAIIAAGAVVTKDVKPMTLVAGVPAVEKRRLT